MSRGLSASNAAEVAKSHLHVVLLVKMAFDTPVYVHSGIGSIVFDANTYTGVGDFGAVSAIRESELLAPSQITLSLSGIDTAMIAEALNSGRYGDRVTFYIGYRQDDGTLVDDPVNIGAGQVQTMGVNLGDENEITVEIQHDLAVLEQKSGARFTDEDQQTRYSGDVGFEFVSDASTVKLLWGGGPVGTVSGRTKEILPTRDSGGDLL